MTIRYTNSLSIQFNSYFLPVPVVCHSAVAARCCQTQRDPICAEEYRRRPTVSSDVQPTHGARRQGRTVGLFTAARRRWRVAAQLEQCGDTSTAQWTYSMSRFRCSVSSAHRFQHLLPAVQLVSFSPISPIRQSRHRLTTFTEKKYKRVARSE